MPLSRRRLRGHRDLLEGMANGTLAAIASRLLSVGADVLFQPPNSSLIPNPLWHDRYLAGREPTREWPEFVRPTAPEGGFR